MFYGICGPGISYCKQPNFPQINEMLTVSLGMAYIQGCFPLPFTCERELEFTWNSAVGFLLHPVHLSERQWSYISSLQCRPVEIIEEHVQQ